MHALARFTGTALLALAAAGAGDVRAQEVLSFGDKVTIVSNTAGILGGIRIWER